MHVRHTRENRDAIRSFHAIILLEFRTADVAKGDHIAKRNHRNFYQSRIVVQNRPQQKNAVRRRPCQRRGGAERQKQR